MLRLLAYLKRRLHGGRKGSRIFDESALGGQNDGLATAGGHADGARGAGVSALLAVALAPLALVSCLSRPPGDGVADGAWASSEFTRIEMDYLMVNDGMRYAIYV
ncbi:hypothetical protein Taro_039410 [Colocasia esculenta]|uniref:Uncharacterized protein n=1 Tax=Colocasia esculenta TaxID=4460 RepID=A0A843W6C2_COLES|nr:hypothetical protein [Colocasia esculenta]